MAGCQQKEATPKLATNFSYSSEACCSGQYFFKDESANATRYDWSFGDGGKSTLKDPPHYYNKNGSYPVTLTATGVDGSEQSLIRQINVENAPYKGSIVFWTNANAGSAIEVVIKYPSAGNIVGYINSYLPSGTPSCDQSGFFTVSLPEGSYNYTAKAGKYTWEGTFNTAVGSCLNKKLIL